MQLTTPNWYQPAYYASWHLATTEKNYWTTEREAFGMIYSFTKFRHYLSAESSLFMLIT